MNFVMSYSGGKDSALALYRMIRQGNTPVALITTVNVEQGRSWFHGIQADLLQAIADSLEIPVLLCECKADAYTQSLESVLAEAKKRGAQAAVFGDIDIEGHRVWNEERCKNTGLSCILPLWGEDREALTNEMMNAGFKAVIKIIQSSVLDESFLGETLTPAVCQRIGAAGADLCGENGEYHTVVLDGPVFSRPVEVEMGEIIDFGTHKAVDIIKKNR